MDLPGLYIPEEISTADIRDVIAHLLIQCPVYRFYPRQMPLSAEDLYDFTQLIRLVSEEQGVPEDALRFLTSCFLEKAGTGVEAYDSALLFFWQRCMQFSGPLMAKGIEDTFSYNYFPLLAHSEVGSIPGAFGMSIPDFHHAMKNRFQTLPLSMNATATHDTKRGEDTRARLLELGNDPGAWFRQVLTFLTPGSNDNMPDANEQYFVAQALYGAIPFEPAEEEIDTWKQRLGDYIQKAAREAKKHSGWERPDVAYEAMLLHYAGTASEEGNPASQIIRNLLENRSPEIIRNSLVQLVLKCTCPGVADIYQGTELWDLSFVDPDNRRAVDFGKRATLLDQLSQRYPQYYSGSLSDPAIKMFTMVRLLDLRKTYPDVFSDGAYESIDITGPWISYTRRYQEHWIWVILPLEGDSTIPADCPQLPAGAPEKWKNIFTGKIFSATGLTTEDHFCQFPVMVAYGSGNTSRSAGVLLPLSALLSADTTESIAPAFIRFLSRSGQKFWQMLPLNPVLADSFFSPYAAASAFASDALYIDLFTLKSQGWLDAGDNLNYVLSDNGNIDYAATQTHREILLRKAWQAFKNNATPLQRYEFTDFCTTTSWLEDYALYAVLKTKHLQNPWYEWPEPYRLREEQALSLILSKEQEAIRYEQWKQFIFRQQWKELRKYAAQHNVKLIGDVPFYMGADAADVWANQHLFHLDAAGKPERMAGVPPDYFSETGQLWGMPTYNWEAMEAEGYRWWLDRLKDNMALFDLIRLDHFRAFYDYWEVPAGEQNRFEWPMARRATTPFF